MLPGNVRVGIPAGNGIGGGAYLRYSSGSILKQAIERNVWRGF
jgi:hypothetical protein